MNRLRLALLPAILALVTGCGADVAHDPRLAREGLDGAWVWPALLTLGSICGVLAFLLVTGRNRVLCSLGALLETTRRIRRGDLEARATATADDAIGRLASEINFMADSLGDSRNRLEGEVERRTRALLAVHEELVRSEKMTAVDRLAGGVAHELNNPLTAIMGYAELVRDELARAEPQARHVGWLNAILKESHRCRRIITDLQQFVRRDHPTPELFRLDEAVRRAVGTYGHGLATPLIRLEFIDDGSTPIVFGSPFKIERVVLSLVDNAVEAVRKGRESGSVWVDVRSEGPRAVVEVRDDGPGILEPDRIFDPFYTTKGVGAGPGLGLSVCYGVVKEHDGTIQADNWTLGGRVRIELPLNSHGAGSGDAGERARPAVQGAASE